MSLRREQGENQPRTTHKQANVACLHPRKRAAVGGPQYGRPAAHTAVRRRAQAAMRGSGAPSPAAGHELRQPVAGSGKEQQQHDFAAVEVR